MFGKTEPLRHSEIICFRVAALNVLIIMCHPRISAPPRPNLSFPCRHPGCLQSRAELQYITILVILVGDDETGFYYYSATSAHFQVL